MGKPQGLDGYKVKKEEFGRYMLLRASIATMAKQLGVSEITISRWKVQWFNENGTIGKRKSKQLQKEFLSNSFNEIAMAKQTLFSILSKKDLDEGKRIQAVNALGNMLETESKLLSRFKVIPNEKIDQALEHDVSEELKNWMKPMFGMKLKPKNEDAEASSEASGK